MFKILEKMSYLSNPKEICKIKTINVQIMIKSKIAI